MYVEDLKTNEKWEVTVDKISNKDFPKIKKSGKFGFDWDKHKNEEVYKISILGTIEILGLMCVIDHPEPQYDCLEIKLIEINKDHQGKDKGLDRIGGNLLGFAALLSDQYGHEGFLALIVKSKRAALFHEKYGFQYIGSGGGVAGERMMSDTINSIKLAKEYTDKSISDETK